MKMQPSTMMSEKPLGEEKRAYPRVEVSLPATILNAQEPIDGVVKNISLGGVFILLRELPVLNGAFLDLVIEMPEHQHTIFASGEMVRVDIYQEENSTFSYGVGVCFAEISQDDLRFLSSTILR